MRSPIILAILAFVAVVGFAAGTASAIDAVRGKEYRLTPQHGPWMIMAASFRDMPEGQRKPGLSAREAADELVFELRQKGIPAYTYEQSAQLGKIDSVDRLGREDARVYKAKHEMVSVLAGNYSAIDDATAQKTLAYVKKFYPKFMRDESSGGVFYESARRKGPLGGAILTINPLMNPNDVAAKTKDSLLIKLNSGIEHSLAESNGKYTLRVATFTGKKTLQMANGNAEEEREFEKKLISGTNLNDMGEDATQLCARLRQLKKDAYVHHDRYESWVTVGSFNTPDDPRIQQLYKEFCAKPVRDRETGQEVLKAEIVELPSRIKDQPLRTWLLDGAPRVVPVPRLK